MSYLVDTLENSQANEQPVTVFELVDVSHRMMFNRAKAEQSLNQLISAGVSHELRNPL